MSNTSDITFSKLFLRLALAVATYSSGLGAARAAVMNSDSLRVSVKGLDLHSTLGRATLRPRVQAAAVQVCGEQDPGAPTTAETFVACVQEAIRGAEPRVSGRIAAADRPTMLAAAAVPAK
jgi:UrcA family protein